MSDETVSAQASEPAKPEGARSVPPVSPTNTVWDGSYAYNLERLRSALTPKEQGYLDELRAGAHEAARERVRDHNAKAAPGTERVRYSRDVADAQAWREYHHRHPRSAERALRSVSPEGPSPSAKALADTDRAVAPELVSMRQGDQMRFSDLRAYVQPIDARERPLDEIRERAERQGRDLSPQEIWQRYEAKDPTGAAEAERGVRKIQSHIDAGRYPEPSVERVIQSRFREDTARYIERQTGQVPSQGELSESLRSHYSGWAKSEDAWRAYEDRVGIQRAPAESAHARETAPERSPDRGR